MRSQSRDRDHHTIPPDSGVMVVEATITTEDQRCATWGRGGRPTAVISGARQELLTPMVTGSRPHAGGDS
jgi:hypothetical protein